MKRRLYYSFLIFLSKPGMSLFIAFELFILIFAANFALGQYNSRTMLYEPLAPYIEKQGFFVQSSPFLLSRSSDNGKAAKPPELTELFEDIDTMQIRHIGIGGLDITVLPDDVFDSLRLPVSEGSLFKSSSGSSLPRIIVTPNQKGYKAGDTVTLPQEYTTATEIEGESVTVRVGDDITLKFAAVLTDPTYIMHFTYSYDMSFENMYLNFSSEFYQQQFFCYTCQSEIKRFGLAELFISDDISAFVCFKNELSEDEYSAAKAKLEENGYTVTDNSLIEENSKTKLSDEFKKLLPAVFTFGVIVLIGIISCSVIGAKTMLKKLAVFYCCGASKSDCILISVGQTVIISLIALAVSAGALEVFILTRLSNRFGFVFRTNNLILTAGLILGAVMISAIAPTVLISKAEPRELLTGNAEE